MSWIDLIIGAGHKISAHIPELQKYLLEEMKEVERKKGKILDGKEKAHALSDEELERAIRKRYHEEGKRDAKTMGMVLEFSERKKKQQ